MLDPDAPARAALGARCRELLETEAVQEAVKAVDQEYREAIFRTRPDDAAGREALYHEYHAFRRVLRRLNNWAADGVMAQQELQAENK